MRCSHARPMIITQLDNELSAKRSRTLQQHVVNCSSCLAYRLEMTKLNSRLSGSAPPELPGWIHHRIIAQTKDHDNRRVKSYRLLQLQKVPALLAIAFSLWMGGLMGTKVYNSINTSQTPKTLTANSALTEYTGFGESSSMDLISFNHRGINE